MKPFRMISTVCVLGMLAPLGVTADGDQPLLHSVEAIRVHLAKDGSGWIELHATFMGTPDEANRYDVLARYGATDRKTTISDLAGGKRRVVSRGRFTDVLQMVKILDSGSFLLFRHKDFEIAWSRGLLRVGLAYKNRNAEGGVIQGGPLFEVSTDGRFTRNTGGEVNAKRNRTVIKSQTEMLLEIEGLGVE